MCSTWDRLTVLEKKAFKHAVRIPGKALRTRTLLNLAGVEERAQPIHGKRDVSNHVSRAKHVRFDFVNRADMNATNTSSTSSKARGATATTRVSL